MYKKTLFNLFFYFKIIIRENEIFSNKGYSKLLNIECDESIKIQIKILEAIDYYFLISKDDLNQYKIKMKRIWKNNMSFRKSKNPKKIMLFQKLIYLQNLKIMK